VSVYLGGKNEWDLSLRRRLTPAARTVTGIRRLVATRRSVLQGRASAEFSPLAHALAELERIMFAPDALLDGAAPGAKSSGTRGSLPDAGAATRPRAPFAAVHASHTSPGRGAGQKPARGVSLNEGRR
jgi:hypothetical protein